MLTEVNRYLVTRDQATNRHSVRVFTTEQGNMVALDQTLDGVPPFFYAYHIRDGISSVVHKPIMVDGSQCWGDGLTWPQAIQKLTEALA